MSSNRPLFPKVSDMDKIKWVNYWIDRGFSVIPVHHVKKDGSCSCYMGKECHSAGKHPASKTWKKYQENKTSKDQANYWFEETYKDFNLGIVTGSVSNNIFVVDVDVAEGKMGAETLDDLQMANDDLPHTLEQTTGSGGKHYFFKAPKDIKIITGKNTLGDGIDTRGEGGFVVTAPSNHKSGNSYKVFDKDVEIADAPEWLLNNINAANLNGSALVNPTMNRWGEMVDGREGYMVHLIIGTIRTWWATKGLIPTVDELVEETYPTYLAKAKERGRSLDEDGRGISLFKQKAKYQVQKAKNNELNVIKNVEPKSELIQRGSHITNNVVSIGRGNGLDRVAPPIRSLTISDWGMDRYSGTAPEQEWLIENILPKKVPGLLCAIGGLGKSYILLDLALKVAGGDNNMHQEYALGGKVMHNGKVVFLSAEDSADSMHRRIDAIDDTQLKKRASGNLFVIPMPDAGGTPPIIQQQLGMYSISPQFEDIKNQLKEMGDIALLVIDPLQAFAHADINSDPASAQFWWSAMSELCVLINGNIIVSHHMRKDGTFSIRKSVQARESIRGTTALVDGARWVYGLWNMPEQDENVVADKLGFESGTGHCVCGGVVKVNDKADNSTKTFVRQESGLLTDQTPTITAILDQSGNLETSQVNEIFAEIDRRWHTDQPFALGTNTMRSFLGYLRSEYAIPSSAAKKHLNSWMSQGLIVVEIHTPHLKMKGLKLKEGKNV